MKTNTITLSLAAIATLVVPAAASAQDKKEQAMQKFAAADTDKDGALSAAEWKAAGMRDRGFKMADTNGDGKVTPEELQALAAKRGG